MGRYMMTQLTPLFFVLCSCLINYTCSFNVPKQNKIPRKKTSLINVASRPQEVTSPVKPENQRQDEPFDADEPQVLKEKVMDLLPRMKTDDEIQLMQKYINTIESHFIKFQTLGFMNLAVGGEWRLLFSTKLRGGLRPNFRITEMTQIVEPSNLAGTMINRVQWELVQDDDSGIFDCFGSFSINSSYEVNEGGRMSMNLNEHKLELTKGSTVPKDIPTLIELLNKNMPAEWFDPTGHAIDATYVDSDFKITRLTGPTFEGVRNIFVRMVSK